MELKLSESVSVKSLAFRVLCGSSVIDPPENSCPKDVPEEIPIGTGQQLGQTAGQSKIRTIEARMRGFGTTTPCVHPTVCDHCHGQKLCACAGGEQGCGVGLATGEKGPCGWCLGTGWLAWPEPEQVV